MVLYQLTLLFSSSDSPFFWIQYHVYGRFALYFNKEKKRKANQPLK